MTVTTVDVTGTGCLCGHPEGRHRTSVRGGRVVRTSCKGCDSGCDQYEPPEEPAGVAPRPMPAPPAAPSPAQVRPASPTPAPPRVPVAPAVRPAPPAPPPAPVPVRPAKAARSPAARPAPTPTPVQAVPASEMAAAVRNAVRAELASVLDAIAGVRSAVVVNRPLPIRADAVPGVDVLTAVRAVQDAVESLAGQTPARSSGTVSDAIIGAYDRWWCPGCGSRYLTDDEHGCGPLVPVTVTITTRAGG